MLEDDSPAARRLFTAARGLRTRSAAWLLPLLVSGCALEFRAPYEGERERGRTPLGSPRVSSRPTLSVPEARPTPREPGAGEPEAALQGPGVSFYGELLVLDPLIVQGPWASNASAEATLAFRAQMAWLAGGDAEALAFTLRWLEHWERSTHVEGAGAELRARPALGRVLVAPWLGAVSPEPYASPRYGDVADADADAWAIAPFRLLAVVNRVDLAADACEGEAGELRIVYTAVDPYSERALDLTLIVEIPYPRSRTAAAWARAWQAIGEAPAGAARAELLVEAVREIQREADPLRARVRSNEAALGADGAWQMREFGLKSDATGALALVAVPLASTPRADVEPSELAAYLLEHEREVMAGAVVLPEGLRAGAAETSDPGFTWRVPGVGERLRRAFSAATCNGCHAGEASVERFQHIAPAASLDEPARLSRFLFDEAAPEDELWRRAARVAELSRAECPGHEARPPALY